MKLTWLIKHWAAMVLLRVKGSQETKGTVCLHTMGKKKKTTNQTQQKNQQTPDRLINENEYIQ